MIVVMKQYKDGSGADPVLVYDADEEEMWGQSDYWQSSLELVGLSESDFSHFFPAPNFITGEADSDPFADEPKEFQEILRNYPPGEEDIPDYPTPDVPGEPDE